MNYSHITVTSNSFEDALNCGPSGPKFICASHLMVAPLSCLVGVKLRIDVRFVGFFSISIRVSVWMTVSPLYHLMVRFLTGAIRRMLHVKL